MTTRAAGRTAVLALAAGVAAACGAQTPDLDDSGAVGPDARVDDDVSVLQVQLAYPLDGVHEAGADAPLYLGIANTGPDPDELVEVRGPGFADALLTVDGEPVAAIPVPAEDNVYVGAEGAPSVVLEDLAADLRSSQSVPVTLVFADAGAVTVDAMVASERTDPETPYDFPDPAGDPST